MSVTLEQCNLLIAHHDMRPSILQEALDAMRSNGVRRENLVKNIGENRCDEVFSLSLLFEASLM